MSVKLKKEHLHLSRVVCSRYCQTTAECDVIVPDIKPDVLKVLRVSSDAFITQKTLQTDKVFIQGIIRLDILYIPDGSVLGTVKSICCNHEFNHTIDIKGVKPGMSLVAEVECDTPEFTLVNSRKLNIRNKLGINLKVSATSDIDIATAIDGNEPVETNLQHLKICNSCCDAERDIIIRERLEVPAGKPDIGEMLKISVKAIPVEMKLLEGKVIAKGELKACSMYCDNSEDSTIQCMEHTIPFTEILEADGVAENMSGEIDYIIKNIFSEIGRDGDGDKRILNVEITVGACLKATEIVECDAICDAYGLRCELAIETDDCFMEQLIETAHTTISQKESICVPDYLPDIYQVCDCSGVPSIENVTVEKGSVTVSGFTTCNPVYLTSDKNTPLTGFSHILPFSHTFEIPEITENSICDAKAELEHLSYTISDSRNIEIRAVIALSVKAVNSDSCKYVSAINYDQDAPAYCTPSIVVYFVQNGDTLWNIAKRYRTTPEAILSLNGNETECIKPGNRIYIFK